MGENYLQGILTAKMLNCSLKLPVYVTDILIFKTTPFIDKYLGKKSLKLCFIQCIY